jgi:2-oxoisovalerate dehydrogenase E1 component
VGTPATAQQSSATGRFEGLDPDQLIRAFRIMHTARRLDDREITLKRQNRIFFQISGAGHEAVQVGAAEDPASGGRQMPSHWGNRRRHIVSGSSPTGTQFLQAVGCAEASRYPNHESDEITLVTCGEGATSEGEF